MSLSKEQFINKSIKIHGDKYDYSRVIYTGCFNPVIILCPIHGEFKQIASYHTSGNGCQKCSKNHRYTLQEFIEEANKIHNNKYDYSLFEYKKSRIKSKIICKKHGIFQQSANSHLSGHACPKCGVDIIANSIRQTKENFIERSKIVHGDKYDYSRFEYLKNNKASIIICPIHGEFKQTPHTHINSYGCKKCSGILASNLNDFISVANKKHCGKYDYSKFVYIKSIIKSIIICPIHGEFLQSANRHLNGYGCKKCSSLQILDKTRQKFIEKAKAVHGDKYDYSNFIYVSCDTKGIIICKNGHKFKQNPTIHLSGKGCPYCAGNAVPTTEEFIEKAKAVHGDKYDYKMVKYINNTIKISIICREHGPFLQSPGKHLEGSGCRICNVGRIFDTSSFKEESIRIHGDKYDYSESIYNGIDNKVIIYCKIHGKFEQRPYLHLKGHGCSNCFESSGEKEVLKYITNHNLIFDRQKKFHDCISISKNNRKTKLPFDFCIYDNRRNIITLIEYDGIGHFKVVNYNGCSDESALKTFKKTKINDSIKNNYCRDNNINLLRIPYTDFNNIEKVLDNYFSSLNNNTF